MNFIFRYIDVEFEDNQSYHQWKKLIQSVNYASDGDIIYLQPIGDFDNIASAPDMKVLFSSLSFFYLDYLFSEYL